jgi:ATP-dependent Clp protease ATP-binding subunit ClpA
LELQAKNKKTKIIGTINSRDIIEQLSKIIDVPVGELLLDERDRLTGLEKELRKFIVGQDNVITEVSQIIRQSQLQLSNPDQPLASFIFVGDSGVGKTELAKTLAKTIYPGSDSLIKLDMSEFNESFSISKLLGSPAGYVGYKDGNQFADKIKMNPYSVVLFDEIDKAHKDVVKLLLQILENGEITDATNRKISLKHAIIILTTTIGAKEVSKAGIGFGHNRSDKMETEKYLKEKLKDYFSPEIINRIDKICLFNNLQEKDLIEIGKLEINRLNERLSNYHTKIEAETNVVEWLIKQLSEKNSNARDARHYVRQKTEELMAKIILDNKIKQKYKLSAVDNKLSVI